VNHVRGSVVTPMGGGGHRPIMTLAMRDVTDTYPVVWALNGGAPITGTLEIAGEDIRLAGHAQDGTGATCRIAAAEVFHVSDSGAETDRVNGRRAVVVDERGGRRILIASQAGGEHLNELAVLLQDAAGLAGRPLTRVVVRVPVDAAQVERVRELVRRGPPYDLTQVPGLERHEVYVTDRDVMFVFEGADPGFALERVMRDARVWSALERWDDYVAGQPSVLEPDYTWSRRP
jgi:hypothetical protein